MKAAVLGGGIAGLACARVILEKSPGAEVFVLEGQKRAGGPIETLEREGFTLEMGPDSFISEKPWGLELCRKLGLEPEIIGTRGENRRSFVVRRKKLIPLPEGFYLIAPLRAGEFLKTPLFSWPAKCRMMLEPFLPARKDAADESVAQFVRRRFGKEALERAGQPMLAGIYTGDPEYLSLQAALPRFRDLELQYGSVTRGLRASRDAKNAFSEASGPRYGLFLSLKNGMETLTRKLVLDLPRGALRLGVEVKEIVSDAGQWKIIFATGEMRVFDRIACALPARKAAPLLQKTAPSLSEKLAKIRYESVATVNLAYRTSQISHPLDGFGFVVPKTEESPLVACTFVHKKFPHRAPEGHALLRAFVGGAFGRHFFEMDDAGLISRVQGALAELLGIQGGPEFAVLRRYPDAMVQYGVGHAALVSEIEEELKKFPGLELTGASYRGTGIPDCIHDAELRAEALLRS